MWDLFLIHSSMVSHPQEPSDDVPTLAAPVVPVVEGVPTGPVTTVGGQQYEEVHLEKADFKVLESKPKAKLPQPSARLKGAMRPPEPEGSPPKRQKVETETKQLFLRHGAVKPKVEEEEDVPLSSDQIASRIFAALVPWLCLFFFFGGVDTTRKLESCVPLDFLRLSIRRVEMGILNMVVLWLLQWLPVLHQLLQMLDLHMHQLLGFLIQL
jgi:hypothetical protein